MVVVVGINKLQVAGTGCLSVHGGQLAHVFALLYNAVELQAVEGAQRFAPAQNLLFLRPQYHVVGDTHVRNLVLVACCIGAYRPQQVAALQQGGIHAQFHAPVHHVAHVLHLCSHTVGKAHGHHQQQVAGLFVVGIKHYVHAVLPQSQVEAYVIRCRGLPFQVVVGRVLLGIAA